MEVCARAWPSVVGVVGVDGIGESDERAVGERASVELEMAQTGVGAATKRVGDRNGA